MNTARVAAVIAGVMAAGTLFAEDPQPLRVLKGHEKSVCCVVFSSDGKTLVSAGKDDTIRLWNLATGVNSSTIEEKHTPWSVAIDPAGKTLAYNSDDEIKLRRRAPWQKPLRLCPRLSCLSPSGWAR